MILPPSTIGVLGGGQLGRYAVMAARTMGYGTAVLDPDPAAPAGAVADTFLVAPYDDDLALRSIGSMSAVVTVEFENPPVESLRYLSGHTCMRPAPDSIGIAQSRIDEKRFLRRHGFPVAPYAVIESAADLELRGNRSSQATGSDALSLGHVEAPAILKTARLGYDGKGQLSIGSLNELRAAWEQLDGVPCVLERRVAFDREVSVVVARSVNGTSAVYDVAENRHVDGILDVSIVPARIPPALASDAQRMAIDIARALDYIGVLAVEMFVVGTHLVVNELAPRPHNSGHWTLDAAATSQFEQQVRAVCGVGLGRVERTAPAVVMVNLLGHLWREHAPDWGEALSRADTHLHLYGKAEPRPGRKMGHLTVTATTIEDALRTATACRAGAQRSSASDVTPTD